MKKGDKYLWNGIRVTVRRVAVDGTWADLYVDDGSSDPWTKRQRLPFPKGFRKATW